MSPFKQLILGAYYYGTVPLRSLRNRYLAARGLAPVMAVAYHRIADDAANAWTTSNDAFERGIRWLQEHFDVVSIEEAQRRIRAKANYRPSVSITFDDGYAVNCERALPYLIDNGIPFAYFVTSCAVVGGEYFPHDADMGNRFAPNTLQDLKSLAGAGAEIGAHARHHVDLGKILDEKALYDEIVTAGEELRQAIGCKVRYFAFPFGQHHNLNRRGFELAKQAGYEAMLSAYGGYNFPGDDPFHLQRMCVDRSFVRLKNWVTLDPYKQFTIRHFTYDRRAATRQRKEALQS